MKKNDVDVKVVRVVNGTIMIPMTKHFQSRLLRFCRICEKAAHECKGEETEKALVKKILTEIDKLFGKDASRKIFMDVEEVTCNEIVMFEDGLSSLFEKWAKEGAYWR